MAVRVAYAPEYVYSLPEGHRFPMEKYELLCEQLIREGTLTETQLYTPNKLSTQDILRVHTSAYWNKLNPPSLSRREIRDIGFPVTSALIERGRIISQGTVDNIRHAQQGGVALNIAGGTHHAYADHGEGFCVFNDFALAAHCGLQYGWVERVLIVDLDVHQGNGTAHIFREDERVFTFSMHGAKNYPLRKESSDLDIGLPDGCEDSAYLEILAEHLPGLIDSHQPDLICYLAGADPLDGDKLGRLSMTLDGLKCRDEQVLGLAHRHQIPLIISMGGGYHRRLSTLIEAHAQTFRVAMNIYS